MTVIGNQLIHIQSCSSTNEYVRDLAKVQTLEAGTVVYTTCQTHGKGQRGNTWTDIPGESLAMSIWLTPDLPVTDAFLINKAIALSVCEALSSIAGEVFLLKWPNDVLYQGRKVCGILLENTIQQGQVTQCIAGIGININQTTFPDNLPLAVSMRQVLGHEVAAIDLLQAVCLKANHWWQLCRVRPVAVHEAFDKALADKGVMQLYTDGRSTDWGCLQGVDEQGRALIDWQGVKAAWPHGSLKASSNIL